MIDHQKFQQLVWRHYAQHGRHDLPWRQLEPEGSIDPYKILVSEVMLQQTQVARVIPKFEAFMLRFPTIETLADAPLGEVLSVWSGLGYNRRAKFLWQAAGMIVDQHKARLPDTIVELKKLPGVGENTAGALLTYAYNQPAVFVETNIRTVFIHHFFEGQQGVSDADVRRLVEETSPGDRPGRTCREWYWALMDYGVYLKQAVGNLNTLSKHYVKQSAFHGSRRQLRGQVLRLLGASSLTHDDLRRSISDERLVTVLEDLVNEELIHRIDRRYLLGRA